MIFRRRPKPTDEQSADSGASAGRDDSVDHDAGLPPGRPDGPWDRSETDADEQDPHYIDLGGLVVRGREGLELRLQVDEQTQTVSSVLFAGPESGLELRAFAAPRHEDLWDDIRADIAAEAAKRGGTATETEGEYGTELKVVVNVKTPDGRNATQASRIVGVNGPRWLLRATFLGKSAAVADPTGVLESTLRDVIVVRGDAPMAPRVMLPLTMPTGVGPDPDDGDAAVR